jgi:3-oxoacyl-[acyl-carrier-protein] synthase II
MSRTSANVVVTGLGGVTALGQDVPTTWRALLAGECGQGPVTLFDVRECRCQQGAVAALPEIPGLTPKQLSRLPRATRLALPAVGEALRDAGLLGPDGYCLHPCLTLSLSTTGGGMGFAESFVRKVMSQQRRRLLGEVARYQPQQQALDIGHHFRFGGPVTILANACSSGANALGHAMDLIASGRESCVLAGGYEALTELIFLGFDSLQAASPERCRPFDELRTGLIMGEGAGFCVLEEEQAARQRGARILCRLAGYGHVTDLHHLTQPAPSGASLVEAMRQACRRAELRPEDIGYVNAHGTATPINDAAETASYLDFFGANLCRPRISSTKAAMGHTLGAAGAIEAIIAIKTLLDRRIPPQINTTQPIPAMAPRLVGPHERLEPGDAAMSVNLGFGGSNAALIFLPYETH